MFRGLASLYRSVQGPFHPIDQSLRARLLAFARSHPTQTPEIAQAYRRIYRDSVLQWSLLSANNRTIAIFIACLCGRPWLYFLFELVVLNGALVWLIRGNRTRREALNGWLSQGGG